MMTRWSSSSFPDRMSDRVVRGWRAAISASAFTASKSVSRRSDHDEEVILLIAG